MDIELLDILILLLYTTPHFMIMDVYIL